MAIPIESELSGSTNGRMIPAVATATPGTAVHTAGASGFEKVWLYASNVTASDATITVEWGGVTAPGDHLVSAYRIPAYSNRIRLCEGEILKGGLVIRAFCSVASAINLGGFAIAVKP